MYLLELLILGCGIDLNTKTQLGVSPIISVAYNIAYLTHIPIVSSNSARLMMLILAIIITSIVASLTVGMKIVSNPADGLANVIGENCHKGFGFGENLFNGLSIVISLIIGFVFTGGILGIGLGTVISMIFTGCVIAVLETSIFKLYSLVTDIELVE